MMSHGRKMRCLVLLCAFALCAAVSCAETFQEGAEQGLDEIRPLLEMAAVGETEGMNLEEMTNAFTDSAMSEYIDSVTGFVMQYPSVFLFDEEAAGSSAATADGRASLTMDHMINDGTLTEEVLRTAILYEEPDAEILKNEQNGCLRVDRISDDGKYGKTDLYLLTANSFHHIVIRYPAEEKGTYFSYIEYMINTMETKETDLG